MQHVDRLTTFEQRRGAIDERVDQREQPVFRYRCSRTGVDMQDTEARRDIDHCRLPAVLGARVHVALDARFRQRTGERTHVHVHAATVARSRLRERRSVHAEDGDTPDGHRGGSYPSAAIALAPCQPASAPCVACSCWKDW